MSYELKGNFTKIPNEIIEDRTICNDTFRTICYMKKQFPGSKFYPKKIQEACNYGDRVWRRVSNKLVSLGIIKPIKRGQDPIFLGIPRKSYPKNAERSEHKVANLTFKKDVVTTFKKDVASYNKTHRDKTSIISDISGIDNLDRIEAPQPETIKKENKPTKKQRWLTKNNNLTNIQQIRVDNLDYDEKTIYDELTKWGVFRSNALKIVSQTTLGDLNTLLEEPRRTKIIKNKMAYFLTSYKNFKRNKQERTTCQ